MSKKEIIDIIFDCSKAGTQVHLKMKALPGKGLFGKKKYIEQEVKRCDLKNQGGCTIKLEPAINSRCPAVIKAQKNGLRQG